MSRDIPIALPFARSIRIPAVMILGFATRGNGRAKLVALSGCIPPNLFNQFGDTLKRAPPDSCAARNVW